jgi:DNA invertase Pin-like site-specific DNA recombinase
MERLGEAEVGFRSLTEAIDTTTAAGRMMMQMVGAFAEFERAMLRERTCAGLETARQEGRVGGRLPKLSEKRWRCGILRRRWSGRWVGDQRGMARRGEGGLVKAERGSSVGAGRDCSIGMRTFTLVRREVSPASYVSVPEW